MTAVSSFDVTSWDETSTSEPAEGPRLARVTIRKVFRGDLDGESVAELLMCQTDPIEDGAGFVASEVVTGRLDGREGTFVMQHGGLMGGGEPPRTFGNIVPGSGTGALAGLLGTVEIAQSETGEHTITLDVRFA